MPGKLNVPEPLLPEEISRELRTKVIGREIRYFPQVDSTNTRARALARAGAPEGTVVIAETQTAGRGRRNNRWESQPGLGIWMTILLRPRIPLVPLQEAAGFTMLAAMSVVRAVEHVCGLSPRIKWPNDVLIGERKVCGILAEAGGSSNARYMNPGTGEVARGPGTGNARYMNPGTGEVARGPGMGNARYILVGIGLNVNQEEGDFSPEVRARATSLRLARGRVVGRVALTKELLQGFDSIYLRQPRFPEIVELIRPYSATLGARVRVEIARGATREATERAAGEAAGETAGSAAEPRYFTGLAVEIAPDGGLVIEDDGGGRRVVHSGEVSIRSADGNYV